MGCSSTTSLWEKVTESHCSGACRAEWYQIAEPKSWFVTIDISRRSSEGKTSMIGSPFNSDAGKTALTLLVIKGKSNF